MCSFVVHVTCLPLWVNACVCVLCTHRHTAYIQKPSCIYFIYCGSTRNRCVAAPDALDSHNKQALRCSLWFALAAVPSKFMHLSPWLFCCCGGRIKLCLIGVARSCHTAARRRQKPHELSWFSSMPIIQFVHFYCRARKRHFSFFVRWGNAAASLYIQRENCWYAGIVFQSKTQK